MNGRTRLDRLERLAAQAPARCPGCGSDNACGVAWEVAADGRAVARCIDCGTEREAPREPAKAYAAILWEPGKGLVI